MNNIDLLRIEAAIVEHDMLLDEINTMLDEGRTDLSDVARLRGMFPHLLEGMILPGEQPDEGDQ